MRCVVIYNNYPALKDFHKVNCFLWSVSNYQVFWLRYYAMREEAILCWFLMKTNQTTSQNAPVEPNDNMSSRFVQYSTFLKFLIFWSLNHIDELLFPSLHYINDLLISSTSIVHLHFNLLFTTYQWSISSIHHINDKNLLIDDQLLQSSY